MIAPTTPTTPTTPTSYQVNNTTTTFSSKINQPSNLGKRTFSDLESDQTGESDPTSSTENKRRKTPSLSDRIELVSKVTLKALQNFASTNRRQLVDPFQNLIATSSRQLVPCYSLIEEVRKVSSNDSQNLETFISWFEGLIDFIEKLVNLVPSYKDNPQKVDVKKLEAAWWDLTYEKFAIPNIFEIYQLYSQEVEKHGFNSKSPEIIKNLDLLKTHLSEMKQNLEKFQMEYRPYEEAFKVLTPEEKQEYSGAISDVFSKTIAPLSIKLVDIENKFITLRRKLSILERMPTNPFPTTSLQTRITHTSNSVFSAVSQSQPIWTNEFIDALFEIANQEKYKRGRGINRDSWDDIAKEMNERFKTHVFDAHNCRAQWNLKSGRLSEAKKKVQNASKQ